jgi:hypothetical protein
MNLARLTIVDPYSFLLGTLFGILFYFLVIDKRYLQKGYLGLKSGWDRFAASTNLEKAESLIKKSIFHNAQSNHLLAHAFPLDFVLIPPHVLPPPKHLYPEFYNSTSSLINQYFPFVPDWPEFSAQFPVDLLSYQQLTKINGKTIILGQPGSGKTVLFNALAIYMLQDTKAYQFPILLSAKRLVSNLEGEKDVLNVLTTTLSDQIPQIPLGQLHYFIKNKITTHTAVLMIDDVDHLSRSENENLITFLTELESLTKFKKIILAADPNMIGKELLQQYFPLPIASWSIEDQRSWIHKFSTAWYSIIPSAGKEMKEILPPAVIDKWIQDESHYYTPFELTIRNWLIHSGYSAGQDLPACLSSVLKFMKITPELMEQLAYFAYALIRTKQSSLTISGANEYLSGTKQSIIFRSPETKDKVVASTNTMKSRIQDNAIKGVHPSLLLAHPDGSYSFASPIWAGFFGCLVSGIEIQDWFTNDDLNWTYSAQYLRFATLQNQADEWHDISFQKENLFLFDNSYLKIARFIPDLPYDHPVRNGILKWLAKNAFQQPVPVSEKAKLFAALLLSNDPSLPKLLLDFQSLPDPELRFLSVLTYASLCKSDHFDVFLNHLSDEDQYVRNAACLAFFALRTKKSTDLLIDILLQGDEYMKQTAAETLSLVPSIRQELLTEALSSEDLLIRRSAVFGLSRIQEQWASDLLSHAAIEDAQWIVRNAASQIVENSGLLNSQLIPQMIHPSNAPWLISFASKLGKGIPKSGFVKDILLTALEQGNVDEKISAMNYLRIVPDEEIIRAVLPLLSQKNRTLQQAASFTLWYIEKIMGAIPLFKEKRIT